MKKGISVVLATLMLVTVLAGCNSGAKPKQSPTAGDAGDTGAVKVGIALPMTGNFAEYGKGMTAAAKLATEECNAAGGVQGRQVELVIMDSKGDAKEASDVARIFTGQEDVLAVITDFSSTCSMAAAPIYEEAGLSQISPTASHPDLPGMGDYIFAIMGRQDDEGPFMATQVAQKYMGAQSVGILYMNNDWGVSVVENFSKACDEINLTVTAKENFVDGEKDFNTALSKIRQTDPEVLVLLAQHNEVAMISKQVKQMGWEIKMLSAGAAYTEQLLSLGGADVEGLISESPFIIEATDKAGQAFVEEIKSRVDLIPGVHAAATYDALGSLYAAMNKAETLTRDGVRDAYALTADYQGLAGPITLDEVGGVHRKYRILTIENGQWKALTNYDYYE